MSDVYADVERREPAYTTTDEIDWPAGPPVGRHPTPVEDLADLPHNGRPTAISIETRKLVVVEWGSVAGSGTADGTGLVDIDLGRVPANQWWLLDSMQVRGAAAGSVLVYDAGQVGTVNDLDLLASGTMVSPGFVANLTPPACYVKPGRQVIVRTVGAGAAAAVSARMLYRVATLAYGEQLVTA